MKRRIGYASLAIVIIVATLYGWAYYGGRNYGGGRGGQTWFSPDTLEMKWRSELISPIGDFPLYYSSFSYSRHELVDYLIAKGYWTPRQAADPIWFGYSSWNDQSSNGHSSLSRSLGRHREFLKKWTELNPEFAIWLWPRVLEQLRETQSDWSPGWVGELLSTLTHSRSFEEFELLLKENRRMYESWFSDETRTRWTLPTSFVIQPVPDDR